MGFKKRKKHGHKSIWVVDEKQLLLEQKKYYVPCCLTFRQCLIAFNIDQNSDQIISSHSDFPKFISANSNLFFAYWDLRRERERKMIGWGNWRHPISFKFMCEL